MKLFLSYILLFLYFPLVGQEFNYVHYNTKDGLPSSTIYRICQDKMGYMWFATDHGVSRFDGKQFTNFTTEDGLTDNEVLDISCDSKGRVWMMPFNKTVCYYYNGKIYNSINDSLLKNIRFSSFAIMSGENKNGDIYFNTSEGVCLYKKTGEFKLIADFKKLGRQYNLNELGFLPINLADRYSYVAGKLPNTMVLFNGQATFIDVNDTFYYHKTIKENISGRMDVYAVDGNLRLLYPNTTFPLTHNTVGYISSELTLFNTSNGTLAVDRFGTISDQPLLEGKNISHSAKDNEGNIWFSTLGDGLYRLASWSMKTFPSPEILCIGKTDQKIFAGQVDGNLQAISDLSARHEYPFHSAYSIVTSKRLYTLKTGLSGDLYLGYDGYLAKLYNGRWQYSPLRPIKSIDVVDKEHIVVCTNYYTLKVRSADLAIVDTIFGDRGTKVLYDQGYYYIGTLNGVVIIGPDKKTTRIGEKHNSLNKRITDLCKSPNEGLWMATNDNGVILYREGRIDTIINIHNGLSSNICKSLYLKYPYLWIGTNKGVNKLDTRTKKIVAKYSISDGLASDIINAIYSEDSIIWIGSPAGLTYFREKDIATTTRCALDLHTITVSGKKIDPGNALDLSYKDNNISFDYTAISLRAGDDIVYRYKIDGLDNEWKETRFTNLSYPSLPPGNYRLHLYALNKFGTQSSEVVIPFSIATPFWKTIWFWTIIGILVIGFISYLFGRRYKRLKQNIEEKDRITKRMTELEQASLRAQMNPHFVFNCLNSIQYFILKNDIGQTNRYITQLPNLIRQTLNNSARANISIADEKNYLASYLELEKMRSTPGFDYSITIDPGIDADNTFIPSMLLQPFVENSIKHGVRLKKGGNGMVKIDIRPIADRIQFTIEDNGPGRQAAGKYKLAQPVEYQSKGTALTLNRIEVLNSISPEKIVAETIDLLNDEGAVSGTRVMILFPMSVMDELSEGVIKENE